MKFTKHSYVYSFERAERLYDKVYYEVELEEGDTVEDAEMAVEQQCKKRALEMQNNFRRMVNENFELINIPGYRMDEIRYPIPQSSTHEEIRIGDIENDIRSCTELKVLETYRLIAKSKPEFQKAYDETFEKLSNQTE